MPLDLDPAADLALAKSIRLGAADYHVLPLPLRQVLAIVALLPKVNASLGTLSDGVDEHKLTSVVEVICRALKRAYPAVTADDILDLPASIDDLVEAIPVIIAQSGGRRRDAGENPRQAASSI